MKYIKLLSIFFLLFVGCKKSDNQKISKAEQQTTINNTDYSQVSLDNLLKCGDYSYMDGYFTVADNGCIYQSSTVNKLGNVEVYLVPKKRFKNDIDIENEESKIKKLGIIELKKLYDISILIIDKKYLIHNAKMDIPYYANYPYKQTVFQWINGFWKNTTTLNINSDSTTEYNDWKIQELSNLIQNENNKSIELKGDYFIKTKVASIETGDPIDISFYFYFENSEAILSIGTNNSLEAYCEGNYSITKNNNLLKLVFTGEGICTSDAEENTFLLKKENDHYYVKSKRFYDFEWHLLNKKSNL